MINKSTLFMALGAITIGFSPIVTKAVTLSPSAISFYRFLFGMMALFIYIKINKFEIHWDSLKKSIAYFALAGFLFSVDLWVWHRSIIYIGAGISTLLANTQIFYLVLIGFIFFKERPKWFFIPGMILAVAGITLSSLPYLDFSSMNEKTLGVIYGLITGLTYALITFVMKKGVEIYQGRGPIPIFFITIFATVASLISTLIEGNFEIAKNMNLFYMLIYGALIHFLGWILITKAMPKLPLALVSLLLLLQPIFATIFGALLFSEALSIKQIIGLAISLIGIYLASNARKPLS